MLLFTPGYFSFLLASRFSTNGELNDFSFKANKGDFVTVDKSGANWTTQKKEGTVTFTKEALKKV